MKLDKRILLAIIYLHYHEYVTGFEFGSNHPDSFLSAEDLTLKYGYEMETHTIQTKDGFFLEIFRVFPKNEKVEPGKKKPILVFHGLFGQSENYIVNGMNNASLAYFLVDNGYDVWLGNNRGNQHGKRHLFLNESQKEFWDFSYHEIGLYDLSVVVDYVFEKSGGQKIQYIGHSQGGSIFLVLCSLRPEYQEKFTFATLLAPFATQKYYNTRFFLALAQVRREIVFTLDFLNAYDLPPSNIIKITDLLTQLCQNRFKFICIRGMHILFGNSGEVNPNLFPLVMRFVPTISVKQLSHFAQMIKTRTFRPYDYGTAKNLEIYGKPIPDDYPVWNITIPTAVYYSRADNMAFYKDTQDLCRLLKNCVRKFEMPNKKWTHIDYFLSENALNVLHIPLLELSRKYDI